jgi:hypothetical protein
MLAEHLQSAVDSLFSSREGRFLKPLEALSSFQLEGRRCLAGSAASSFDIRSPVAVECNRSWKEAPHDDGSPKNKQTSVGRGLGEERRAVGLDRWE